MPVINEAARDQSVSIAYIIVKYYQKLSISHSVVIVNIKGIKNAKAGH
ncbi:hypothetical protein KDA_46190 [Dictyobacter alpinus]|uniref:Uncharacterized protein n=1 Tax=Dictyobacter alpinus TaxID=2014873 RepID=A0A402BCP8_9CHLR|nr:hypothetical protein KDA_46190 [Dictyobacter alpinus]